jgi:hypothetical protein
MNKSTKPSEANRDLVAAKRERVRKEGGGRERLS